MNVFELVRAVRKRLAVANTFELRIEKKKSEHYATLWHEATDRISVLGAELRSMTGSRDHLAQSIADLTKTLHQTKGEIRHEYARGLRAAEMKLREESRKEGEERRFDKEAHCVRLADELAAMAHAAETVVRPGVFVGRKAPSRGDASE